MAQAHVASAFNQAANALYRTARRAKRGEAAQRRTAREAMQALDTLRAQCQALGIELVIVPEETETDARTPS